MTATTVTGIDLGPAIPPPSWCLPDDQPDYSKGSDGQPRIGWDRTVSDDVSITGTDCLIGGRWVRSEPSVVVEVPPQLIDGPTARQLARDLMRAADLVDGGEQ